MKTITTEKALLAYRLLNSSKYNSVDDSDKIKIFKITRALKPIANAYEEASKDAVEKMKFDNFEQDLTKAQEYERKKKAGDEDLPMSEDEYTAFVKKLFDYDKLVKDTRKELGNKEETIDVDLLTEDSFGKLMSCNDWTMEQAILVSDVVCE